MITPVTHTTFLNQLQHLRINPNFFCSEPYLALSGAQTYIKDGMIQVVADHETLFPPLPIPRTLSIKDFPESIWSDFGTYLDFSQFGYDKKMLDYEYIFNPLDFKTMPGAKWETFRKNARKWPNRCRENKDHYGFYSLYKKNEHRFLSTLLGLWMEDKQSGGNNVEDADFIIEYLLGDFPGIQKWFLYKNDRLVGVNACDENYKYVNYRFCIVDKSEPYLDEYMRYCFYAQMWNQTKLVNDGGSLGNPGLERFKDKMNPVSKRIVYSWTKTNK